VLDVTSVADDCNLSCDGDQSAEIASPEWCTFDRWPHLAYRHGGDLRERCTRRSASTWRRRKSPEQRVVALVVPEKRDPLLEEGASLGNLPILVNSNTIAVVRRTMETSFGTTRATLLRRSVL